MLTLIACQNNAQKSNDKELANTVNSEIEENTKDSIPTWITSDYLMGKFNPKADSSFVEIPIKYADRKGQYLRKEVFEAFVKMWEAAKDSNINLVVRSATRNFDYQKGIWERKWNGSRILSDGTRATDISDPKQRALKIMEYSAMPGASRHHWGTDLDFNAFENSYFEQGEGKKVFEWLEKNAEIYGFCRVYTSKATGRTGYNEEKWHWSYTAISSQLTAYAKNHLTDNMFNGFSGFETTIEIGVVEKYVLGIDSTCL